MSCIHIFSLSEQQQQQGKLMLLSGEPKFPVSIPLSSPPNLEIISANVYLLSARIDWDFI